MNQFIKDRCIQGAIFLLSSFFSSAFAMHPDYKDVNFSSQPPFQLKNIVFQIGIFDASQGKAQDIEIQDLVGDKFTVKSQHDQNVLLGLGFFLEGLHKEKYNLMYGLNAFYLAGTNVKGDVIQEHLFTNLSYHYSIINYPVYLVGKALINTSSERYNIIMDLGIGPNVISAKHFAEQSVDNGITIPDNAFHNETQIAFSATLGLGIRFNKLLNNMLPVEIAYRFFYLGEGRLDKSNNQILDNLKTGNSYANALILSVSI